MKRWIALMLCLVLCLSLAACSSKSGSSDGDDKLVVWTLAEDLKDFAERYQEQTGTEVEVTVIAPADYPTKLNTTLGSKNKDVDIIVGEPQMLIDFFDAGFFADLSEFDATAQEKLVDYIYEAG